MVLLFLHAQHGNHIRNYQPQGTGPWQATFYRVHLRSLCQGCVNGHGKQIGSKRFQNHYVYKRMPNAVWLFLDMLHLIMLLANRTKANMDVVKFWFQEAKDFLMGMEKTRMG